MTTCAAIATPRSSPRSGPASSSPEMIQRAVRGRRRRVPPQLQPWHPRRAPSSARHHPRDRARHRPADRRAGRPARAEAARRHASPTARRRWPRASAFRLDLDPAPGDARPRAAAASRRSSRRWRPASICCSTTASCGSRSRRPAPISRETPRPGRRPARRSARGSTSPARCCRVSAADREGPRATSPSRSSSASTGSRCPSCSGRRTSTRCGHWSAARPAIMAKLEKPAAIEQLDAIVARSDAVMVARGDLGVEMPPEQVPAIQKRIVRACRRGGQAGDRRDPDAGIDDPGARRRPGPRPRMSRPRSTTAPTR